MIIVIRAALAFLRMLGRRLRVLVRSKFALENYWGWQQKKSEQRRGPLSEG